jgi:AcrR family transcriptional regulator
MGNHVNPSTAEDDEWPHPETTKAPCGFLSAGRVAKVLAIAKATFGDKGYAATTMGDIAAAAGMSKKTLYKLFENKADLFRAMLTANLHRFEFSIGTSGLPADELRDALRHIADIVFRPEEVALHRLLIAERKQSPALTEIFTDVIFNSGADGVAGCVGRVGIRKELRPLPLRTVADMMVGAIFSKEHFRSMVDDAYRVERDDLNARIDAVIATFCDVGHPAEGIAGQS